MKRNGRSQESVLGHSQKIVPGDENELERKLRRSGDGRSKKNKSGEDGSY